MVITIYTSTFVIIIKSYKCVNKGIYIELKKY